MQWLARPLKAEAQGSELLSARSIQYFLGDR